MTKYYSANADKVFESPLTDMVGKLVVINESCFVPEWCGLTAKVEKVLPWQKNIGWSLVVKVNPVRRLTVCLSSVTVLD